MIRHERVGTVSIPLAKFGITVVLALGLAQAVAAAEVVPAEKLKPYNVDIKQTSVSGVSSGAYMAVQFGVAHSASVVGVGATAGGPYDCALRDGPLNPNFGKLLARCMQGDPRFPVQELSDDHMKQMFTATDSWASKGKIDATGNIARQKLWLFHGYNDGIVKRAVEDRLYDYYKHYASPNHIFYKSNLRSGHAQVTTNCAIDAASCNQCDNTGGKFLNQCLEADGLPYDGVGSMLQHIYGNLNSKNDSGAPKGEWITFSQQEFALDRSGNPVPMRISMDDKGYVYVPQECAADKACRVHIAFHGCLQSETQISDAFYKRAGYNEWADNNRIIVLYPQTVVSLTTPVLPGQPMNPMGCWDWWGYNDIAYVTEAFPTKEGLQIAAVHRMLARLAGGKAQTTIPSAPFGAPNRVVVGDVTHNQVALRWNPTKGASGYNVYRADNAGGPYALKLTKTPFRSTTFSDPGLTPSTAYYYVVKAVKGKARESEASAEIKAVTAAAPPACDPYFNLGIPTTFNDYPGPPGPVTKDKEPTVLTCD